MEIVKIEGQPLVRDIKSGAVLNPDKISYEQFVNRKLKEKHTAERIEDLESTVNELRKMILSYDKIICSIKDKCNS